MPTLYVLSGPEIGRQLDVGDGAVLGRADDCDAVLRHLSVSRRHARIERKRAGWRVVDLGSRNGLFAKGERVKKLFVEDGTEFRLGDLELRLRFGPDEATGGADVAADSAAASDAKLPSGLEDTLVRPAPVATHAPREAEIDDGINARSRGFADDDASPRGLVDDAAGSQGLADDAASSQGAADDDVIEEDFEFADETPVAAPAPRASVGDEIELEDPGEISLEEPDEIELEIDPTPRAAPPAPASPPSTPRAAVPPARPSAAARAGIPTTAKTGGATDPARKALQYHRVETQGGFLSADLAQYPAWVRFAALAVALVMFAGLFVLAFRAAGAM